MLSVPPAFVLSQDQTLKKVCILTSFVSQLRKLKSQSLRSLAITCFFFRALSVAPRRCIYLYSHSRVFLANAESSRVPLWLHCSIFKVLWPSYRQLIYYSTLSGICQPLFEIFFKFFFRVPSAVSRGDLYIIAHFGAKVKPKIPFPCFQQKTPDIPLIAYQICRTVNKYTQFYSKKEASGTAFRTPFFISASARQPSRRSARPSRSADRRSSLPRAPRPDARR